jgi:peroxiredoxin
MRRFHAFFAVVVGLVLVAASPAGEYNQKLSVGDQAPSYHDLPGTDGKTHSLDDLKDKDVVVLVITCNHCPVAVAYEDRILSFVKKFAGPDGKVALVAINVNKIKADLPPKMKERAEEKGFTFPYLFDESQQIARDLGASMTPEFFVLDKQRKIVYMGAFDDATQNPKVNYLEPAVEAALAGRTPEKKETNPRGCQVMYDKRKK